MPGDVRAVYKTGNKIQQNRQKNWEAELRDAIVMAYIPPDKDNSKSNLSGYWMGKYEVSVDQYMEFVNETKTNEPEWNEAGSPYHILTGRDNYYRNQVEDNFPIVGISWDNAAAYCQWLSGKTGLTFKLPTEAQWQKAAQGTDYRLYPWGFEKPGNNLANFFSPSGKTVKVDANPQGASPYGLLNMAGNVEEWCDNQVARGGSFYSNDLYIRCTSRSQYDRKERNHALGFRLCMVGR
jgi:formylglycine-generating enzyme required for sulfatase activity